MAITETELILPTLYLLAKATDRKLTTTHLINELRLLIKPQGEDLKPLLNRNDDKFSQKVRNLISHKTLIKLNYIKYSNGVLTITNEGLEYLQNKDIFNDFIEKYEEEYEGEKTIDFNDEDGFLEEEIEDDIYKEKTKDEVITDLIYPQASLNIERTQFSVFELKRKKENGKLLLDPDFQREDVWKSSQKAELIESILMNIPLPFIYLTENKKGELVVVDGRQRLTALFEFLDDKFSLGKKLKILKKLHNKKFSQLEPILQGTIEDYQLLSHIIKPPTSDRIMIDIFDRVNRSGTKLNNQEIRNALYQGQSTKLLKVLSESEQFKIATNNSIKTDRMKDKYIILRAISFYLWKKRYKENDIESKYSDYKGDTEDFLAKYMEYINSLLDDEIEYLEFMFFNAMKQSFSILGEDAFRLPSNKNSPMKRPINMALFEVLTYFFSDEDFYQKEELVKKEYNDLLNDVEFLNSFLSIDSNVKYRFNRIQEIKNKIKNA
jgi:hypothetical protein